ncbi:uncharacterized protein LACBIDRAFT_306335 [Laccaria bicolor S238N-H82]|uniref:Predicted protein n=1 Tax=Laccaria bicolor (strain S238N-H82 / ATCC MYA-4686) TaxID=486041 RepID=B0DN54_LACBS|nr:uncharacterized protein LACBIDRAFT_306335 [Laccaria bicolor S238N-H82]EDR03996.1 predicted protein [Laccaria bicolor S238N-H82]|eukprot:XP_001885251.1 predicted protein [Laccaria bicolor S238N-H82]
MRLAKQNDQALVLSFEISGLTHVGHKARVAHDVKIEVMKLADVEKGSEPMCPEPDVHIPLPPLQKLRMIVERLRPMSGILAVRVNLDPYRGSDSGDGVEGLREPQKKIILTNRQKKHVIPKNYSRFSCPSEVSSNFSLNSHVVSTTIACICQHHCMILYVSLEMWRKLGAVHQAVDEGPSPPKLNAFINGEPSAMTMGTSGPGLGIIMTPNKAQRYTRPSIALRWLVPPPSAFPFSIGDLAPLPPSRMRTFMFFLLCYLVQVW